MCESGVEGSLPMTLLGYNNVISGSRRLHYYNIMMFVGRTPVCVKVELRGVEPLSEKAAAKITTSVAPANYSSKGWPEAWQPLN